RGWKREVRQIRRVGAALRHLVHERAIAAPQRHAVSDEPEMDGERGAPTAGTEDGRLVAGVGLHAPTILLDLYDTVRRARLQNHHAGGPITRIQSRTDGPAS